MVLIKILYLAVLIVLACFYVLYIDSFALIMLLCALCIPFLLKGILIWLKFTSSVVLTCDVDTCASEESIPVTITVRNQSPFSFSQMHVVIDLQHSFGANKERMHLQFPLQAKNSTRLTFYVHADFCGAMDISLKKIYVLDYLHLFRCNLKILKKTSNILILPKRLPLQISNLSEPVLFPESDTFGDKPGDDPSEIYGLHEYLPGDAVSRIHWKLSSKSEKTLVKEFSTPVMKSVLLLLEFRSNKNFYAKIREAESLLTLFYSLACQMIEMQIIPTIRWFDAKTQHMESYQPATLGQLTDVFRVLYHAIGSMKMDVQELLNTTVGEQYSSVTCITNNLSQTFLTAIDRQMTANQKTILVVCEKKENTELISEETLIIQTPLNDTAARIGEIVI